jgi:hypothetical protein
MFLLAALKRSLPFHVIVVNPRQALFIRHALAREREANVRMHAQLVEELRTLAVALIADGGAANATAGEAAASVAAALAAAGDAAVPAVLRNAVPAPSSAAGPAASSAQ